MNTIKTGTPITLTPTAVNWQTVTDFEKAIAEFFGAPAAVAVDSCTHGIELCLRYLDVKKIYVPTRTYISIPMLANKLKIGLKWVDAGWKDYYFLTENIIDAAVLWKRNSYITGTFMSISFQYRKHLNLSKGGCILCPDEDTAKELRCMSYDGRERDLPWRDQDISRIGYHYYMNPETALLGLKKLPEAIDSYPKQWYITDWPDVSKMKIFKRGNRLIPYTKHKLTGTRLKSIWQGMQQRCNNPNSKGYERYGGRGIKLMYGSIVELFNDLGLPPTENHTLDRINNDGNYEPGNCKWATKVEQARNTSNNVLITIDGVTKCAQEWAQSIPIDFHGFMSRVKLWPESRWLDPIKKPNGFSVSFSKLNKKYRAKLSIKKNGKRSEKHIGFFDKKEDGIQSCIKYLELNPNWNE